jgi:hypothetical protein
MSRLLDAAEFHNLPSAEICRRLSERSGGACLLSFSRGKDAIGTWLQLRRHFERIIPYFMYLVPGLEFEERSLADLEQFFGTRIHRLPNPNLYRMLINGVFQTPGRRAIIRRLRLTGFDRDKLPWCLKIEHKLPLSTFTATGVRRCDNLNRRTSINKFGPVNLKRRQFFPIYDWTDDMLAAELRAAGVKLPIDYRVWGSSFDGLHWRFLEPLKKHFPRDYARVLEFFPLAESGLRRMEYREQWHANQNGR